MIEDREIWACANLLLRQHGREAWNIASRRAQELLAQGEAEGHRTFARIMDRIRELEAVSLSAGCIEAPCRWGADIGSRGV